MINGHIVNFNTVFSSIYIWLKLLHLEDKKSYPCWYQGMHVPIGDIGNIDDVCNIM